VLSQPLVFPVLVLLVPLAMHQLKQQMLVTRQKEATTSAAPSVVASLRLVVVMLAAQAL
jgi:hypothetical protein